MPSLQIFPTILVILLSAPDVYRSFPCHGILGSKYDSCQHLWIFRNAGCDGSWRLHHFKRSGWYPAKLTMQKFLLSLRSVFFFAFCRSHTKLVDLGFLDFSFGLRSKCSFCQWISRAFLGKGKIRKFILCSCLGALLNNDQGRHISNAIHLSFKKKEMLNLRDLPWRYRVDMTTMSDLIYSSNTKHLWILYEMKATL